MQSRQNHTEIHYTCKLEVRTISISKIKSGHIMFGLDIIKSKLSIDVAVTHLYRYLIPRRDCNVWPNISCAAVACE